MAFKTNLLKSTVIMAGILLASTSFAAKWNIAIGDAAGSTQEVMAIKFSEIVKEKTNGKITTELFPNGQLGSEQATVNDIALGTLDMSILGSNNISTFSPSMGILSLPYLFDTVEQAKTVLDGEIGQRLVDDAIKNANARVLGWTYSGFRTMTNSKRPVKKMADLKGLVIRVPKNEILISTYNSFGINPSPIAWSETFTALQQGVVDGQDSAYAAIYVSKFGEIQKYLTEVHYMYQLEPLIISESLFQDQKPEVQKILLEAGKIASDYTLEWITEKENVIKKELKELYGMQIDTLEDEDQWKKNAREQVWPKYLKQVGGKDRVNELLKASGQAEL